MSDIDLSFVVAMTPQRVIGRNNELPWRIPSDLHRFREITMQMGTMIMGRKTFESTAAKNGNKILPGRRHIVVSHTRLFDPSEMLESVTSVEAALEIVRARTGTAAVIGGEQIFELFLPKVRRIYLTYVDAAVEGDTLFPFIPKQPEWRKIEFSQPLKPDPRDEYRTWYETWQRT